MPNRMNVIETEYKEIKGDLRDLKACQRQYFFLSISGAGVILAVARYVEEHAGFPMLAALLLVLPCWRMFFDKASSVTRTSGYIAYLERQMSVPSPIFVGYEQAVVAFRQRDDRGEFDEDSNKTADPKQQESQQSSKSRYGYWAINFWTYFLVCLICILSAAAWGVVNAGALPTGEKIVYWGSFSIAFAAFVWIFGSTHSDYALLKNGKFSYPRMHENWQKVLDFDKGGLLKTQADE